MNWKIKLKIVVVGPVYPFRGGIAHHNSSLISALREQGHEVLSLSYKRQYPSFLYPGGSDKDPSKNKIDIDSKYIFDPINPFTWRKGFYEIIKHHPEKIIFHWWTSFWMPMYWFLLKKINHYGLQTIVIAHNVFPHEQRWFDKYVAKQILSLFDSVIVHSKIEEKKISQLFQRKNVFYFPHPIYDTLNIKLLNKEESKKKLLIKPDTRLLLMFGIIRKYKGLSIMLESLKILVEQEIRNIHLIVAGEFWDPVSMYQQKIKELKIEKFVTIENRYIPNEEIPLIFSAADLFIAPYIGGTQSGAIKLARAYNLPVVSTTIVAEEGEVNGNYWKTVSPGDSVELANAIIKFNPESINVSEKLVTWIKFSEFIVGM